jgi:hypothetical protein
LSRDIIALAIFGSADNTYWLIQRNQHQIIGFSRLNQLD